MQKKFEVVYTLWTQVKINNIFGDVKHYHIHQAPQYFDSYLEIYDNIPPECVYLTINGERKNTDTINWLSKEEQKIIKEREAEIRELDDENYEVYRISRGESCEYRGVFLKKINPLELKVGDTLYHRADDEAELKQTWKTLHDQGEVLEIFYSKSKKTIKAIETTKKTITLPPLVSYLHILTTH